MKAKLNIKKKAVLLTLNPQCVNDSGFNDNITSKYYNKYSSGNLITWETFINKIKDTYSSPFIASIEDYYIDDTNINNFNFDKHTLVSGDNLYFIPGTSVPRFKVKEKGENVGFKTRKTPDSANVFILDNKALTKLSSKIRTADLRVIYKNFLNFLSNFNLDIDNVLTDEQKKLAEESNEVYFTSYLYNVNYNLDTPITSEILSINRWVNNEYTRYSFFDEDSKKMLDIIDNICKDPKKILMSSSALLEQINDTTFIDEKMYKRIDQMLQSDNASIELAMNLMCNVDLKKSLFYIMLLIKNHSQKMRWSNIFNHSNFKAFRISLDSAIESSRDYLFNYSVTGVEVINTLGKLKILKKEHVDYFKDDIKNSFGYSNYRDLFNISKIEASDKLKKMLMDSVENLKEEVKEDESI